MKKFFSLTLAVLIMLTSALSLSSCSERTHKVSVYALDTLVEITLPTLSDGEDGDATPLVMSELRYYEDIFSATREGSELYKLNHSTEETVAVSDELFSMLLRAHALAAETNGAYDYTCGALTEAWKITDPDAPLPTDSEIENALGLVGYEKVTLADGKITRPVGMKIDLGGVAKGYIAERLTELLAEKGYGWGILSLGGNISVFGERDEPFSVGVKNPEKPTAVHGKLTLDGGFVSVSGVYERNKTVDGVLYHHIFDVKTGKCADSDILSVAVVSGDGANADALSTALFVMGKDKALSYLSDNAEVGAVIFLKNGEVLTANTVYEKI